MFKAGEWSLNPDDPSNDMFATLDKLENLRSKQTGGFTFKIQWPDVDGTETMHWKQTSNPVTTVAGGVVGYEAINVTHTQNGWGGLEYNGQECLLDGSVSSATEWFYCVGYYGGQWGHGVAIPSYQRPASAVELFVMNPKTNSWQVCQGRPLPFSIEHNSKFTELLSLSLLSLKYLLALFGLNYSDCFSTSSSDTVDARGDIFEQSGPWK